MRFIPNRNLACNEPEELPKRGLWQCKRLMRGSVGEPNQLAGLHHVALTQLLPQVLDVSQMPGRVCDIGDDLVRTLDLGIPNLARASNVGCHVNAPVEFICFLVPPSPQELGKLNSMRSTASAAHDNAWCLNMQPRPSLRFPFLNEALLYCEVSYQAMLTDQRTTADQRPVVLVLLRNRVLLPYNERHHVNVDASHGWKLDPTQPGKAFRCLHKGLTMVHRLFRHRILDDVSTEILLHHKSNCCFIVWSIIVMCACTQGLIDMLVIVQFSVTEQQHNLLDVYLQHRCNIASNLVHQVVATHAQLHTHVR
mmetsp:Transcript_126009/g.368181  ORF Transcript_126009/g.368181 Transcript_126009/m.368181 type:complete len:309 (+) Transcript_126009:470-1396(+)